MLLKIQLTLVTQSVHKEELIAKELGVSAGIFFDGFDGGEATAELRREIAHLKELLKEKERTIEILMSDRNAKK